MDIKPIETHYNGYRFRSRLEARWAVFFDAAGIKYEYEPEGFELEVDGCDAHYMYLPDFFLPDFNYYVEVKPSEKILKVEQEKLSRFIASGQLGDGLLVLGQIPVFRIKNETLPIFALYTDIDWWGANVECKIAAFLINQRGKLTIITDGWNVSQSPNLPDFGIDELYYNRENFCKFDNKTKMTWVVDPKTIKFSSDKLNKCFDKARKARFEHGETPIVRRNTNG